MKVLTETNERISQRSDTDELHPSSRGDYTRLKYLHSRHHQMLDLVLEGHKLREIAVTLHMNEKSVSRVVHSQLFQHELTRRRKLDSDKLQDARETRELSAQDILQRNSALAAQTHVGLMMTGSERTQLQAASEILDRTGVSRVAKIESRSISINLTPELLDRMNETAQEVFGEPFSLKDIPIPSGVPLKDKESEGTPSRND